MNNKLKSERELPDIFGVPAIGLKVKNEEDIEMICKEIELMCKMKNIKNLLVIVSDDYSKKITVEINKIIEILNKKELNIEIGSDPLKDFQSLEDLEKYQSVVLVSTLYRTSYETVLRVVRKCEQLQMRIVESIVIS